MKPIDIENYEEDLASRPIEALVEVLTVEARRLRAVLPGAQAVQWQPPPRIKAPSAGRGSNDGPANPTADIALDGQRLALRAQVIRSERLLRDAAIALMGTRMGLERALDAWEPEDD